MSLFNKNAEREKLEALEHVISQSCRGIHKRIDENRELLALLYKEAPELMDKCFWIHGWIESQDKFLNELADVSGVKNPFPSSNYPRPFPTEPVN
ncbi:hypothetical protein F4V72_23420 [Salmonella enterica subsp. diarizonae]|uniref:Uncharacterized protein n=1 Tax=Salmonella diarizonae TaxID=59204 RepID=A0A379XXE4_SALDZ|nr:hypothetical protein [Salmonella enterica]ECH9341649.1 hypothetical protein [Salmonella enterica subsp. diarizonae]EDU9903169.1 hypothetical protein [Salmonella enterica subsp. diarizonae]KAA8683486.1 hypothetical protein F4V72_23420 [Salmonella enterica subsp. diarizonae]SUI37551.1 Uncharacterised protein [Salmonella enterica subsp. diarizonae]VFS63746.1 Uncharacterised protein [Salmonella enterica subsp. diarizonae]